MCPFPRPALLALALTACGRSLILDPIDPVDSGRVDPPLPRQVTLSGRIEGVSVAGLVLREDVSAQTLEVPAGARAVVFPRRLDVGAQYRVAIASRPDGLRCELASAEGTLTEPAPEFSVKCRQGFVVGGTIEGLTAGPLLLKEAVSGQLATEAAGSTRFEFAEPFESGALYRVEVSRQPEGLTCTVTRGAATVLGDVDTVAVKCAAPITLSVEVTGLTGTGLTLREALSAQSVSAVPGDHEVRFGQSLPGGARYDVEVASHPLGQVCVVEHAAGSVPVRLRPWVRCGPRFGGVVISEVTASFNPGPISLPVRPDASWVELYNGSVSPQPLLGLSVKMPGSSDQGASTTVTTFALPDVLLQPGQHYVVTGLNGEPHAVSGPTVALLFDAQQRVPLWFDAAAVELARDATGEVLDYVAFGTPSFAPGVAAAWSGSPAPSPFVDNGHEYTLSRTGLSDTQRASDWERRVPTPGGPNDLWTDVDNDADGIPDEAERGTGSVGGIRFAELGAQVGARDVFVEIDWMGPGPDGGIDPGVLPNLEALQRVKEVFRLHGFAVHFDVGDRAEPAPGVDPSHDDLGGGSEVPFACSVAFFFAPDENESHWAYKVRHSDVRRWRTFHYALFADSIDGSCESNFALGIAEFIGNDLAFGLGQARHRDDTEAAKNFLLNDQALTVLHELGHNLGLHHGGDSPANYKPNYLSVMNYLYGNGLPRIGNHEGDRYQLQWGMFEATCAQPGLNDPAQLVDGPYGPPARFNLDLSDGSSGKLDEAHLDEAAGLRRPGSGPVDFDFNGVIERDAGADLDLTAYIRMQTSFACPKGQPGQDVHQDFDDWRHLELAFAQKDSIGPILLMTPSAPVSRAPARVSSWLGRGEIVDERGFGGAAPLR